MWKHYRHWESSGFLYVARRDLGQHTRNVGKLSVWPEPEKNEKRRNLRLGRWTSITTLSGVAMAERKMRMKLLGPSFRSCAPSRFTRTLGSVNGRTHTNATNHLR